MILGNYRTIREIGRGGMGVVYLAEHILLGKSVAIKILHERKSRNHEACQRFLMEARTLAQLRHPHVVEVTDWGQDGAGRMFYVMELLEGMSLSNVIAQDGALPLGRALTILNHVAQALSAAHARGIVHRDLKPDNIVIERRPDRREVVRVVAGEDGGLRYESLQERLSDVAKLVDFGIAKSRELADDPDIVLGTPRYMAPEQIRNGPVDARTDVYALGVLFFEMLTGKLPFDGETVDRVTWQHLHEPPPLPRIVRPDLHISEAVEVVILKAMSKDPARRQQSALEFDHDLQTCVETPAARARPP